MSDGETLQIITDHLPAVESLRANHEADGHAVLRVSQMNDTDWEVIVAKGGVATQERSATDGECAGPERAEGIRSAIREKYRDVADRPEGQFSYPVGRQSAIGLGYPPEWLTSASPDVVDRFVGVGNPFRIRRPAPGERVLDLGCGCGLDVYVAAQLVGAEGRSVGLEMATAMLKWAQRSAGAWPLGNVAFVEGTIEARPLEDDSFDMVISNGVLNLVPDKDAAFSEIHRVLRPGGTFAAADLLVIESIPAEVLASVDAWST